MNNYFNQLTLREQLLQLAQCRLMKSEEFKNGVTELNDKNIVIIGCGSQGLNQGLNMRDSGLNISYAFNKYTAFFYSCNFTHVHISALGI